MLNIACVTDEMLQSLKPINIFGYSSYQTITVPNPNITVPNRANSSGTGTTLFEHPSLHKMRDRSRRSGEDSANARVKCHGERY